MAQRKTASPKTKSRKTTKAKSTAAASRKTKSSSAKASPTKRTKSAGEKAVTIDRRRSPRREEDRVEASEKKASPAPKLERRKKVNRRRQIDPTTCERDYTDEEIQFMNALDDYKRASGRMFPTCSEVLEVVRSLGYVKVSSGETTTLEATTVTFKATEEAENEFEIDRQPVL